MRKGSCEHDPRWETIDNVKARELHEPGKGAHRECAILILF
jgi:hypothetical protein